MKEMMRDDSAGPLLMLLGDKPYGVYREYS